MIIPAPFVATLALVQDQFPGAMLAGGAMRDLDNGREVKDLDIFAPNVIDLDALKAGAARIAGTYLVGIMGGYENWATTECVGVLDVTGPHGPFQLIGLTTGPETILPRIDFGICQIGFDGEQVHRSAAYELDKVGKTFTVVRSDDGTQYERSMRRWDRLREKYPDFRFVDPRDPDDFD